MSLYRALRNEPSFDAEKGDEVDLNLTADEEADLLAAKRFEIVPRRFKVVGSSNVDGTEPDGEFESDMTIGREALLVSGGHIARVATPTPNKKGKEG